MNRILQARRGLHLGDALERELLHEVDDVRAAQELVLELPHGDGEGRGIEHDLALRVQVADELLDDDLELGRQQLVCLQAQAELKGQYYPVYLLGTDVHHRQATAVVRSLSRLVGKRWLKTEHFKSTSG